MLATLLLRDGVVLRRVFIKRAAFMAALCLFFYVIGIVAGPAPASGGLCRVYF